MHLRHLLARRRRFATLAGLLVCGALAAHRSTAQAPPTETLTFNAVADITGDGQVNFSDYFIELANWFTAGDPQ